MVLVACLEGSLSSQPADDLWLRVLFLKPIAADGSASMWLAIENRSQTARLFCHRSWGYAWRTTDRNAPMGGVVSSNTQDCGEGNRPYWLVLPGQTRFDAFEIRVPGGTTLFDVDLVLQEIGVPRMGAPPIRRWLKWSGTVDDAIAAGQKVGIEPAGNLTKPPSREARGVNPSLTPCAQCLPNNATSTRASLKQAPPPRSVKASGTRALVVEPL